MRSVVKPLLSVTHIDASVLSHCSFIRIPFPLSGMLIITLEPSGFSGRQRMLLSVVVPIVVAGSHITMSSKSRMQQSFGRDQGVFVSAAFSPGLLRCQSRHSRPAGQFSLAGTLKKLCGHLLGSELKLRSVNPDAVQHNSQLSGHCHAGNLHRAALRNLHAPGSQPAPFRRPRQHDLGSLI